MGSSNFDWEAFLEGFETERKENKADILEGRGGRGGVGDFSAEKKQAKNPKETIMSY